MARVILFSVASVLLVLAAAWLLVPRGVEAAESPGASEASEVSGESEVTSLTVAQERADAAVDALMQLYWNPGLRMFNNAHPCQQCNDQFHYWWQAHGIDALLDAYERTGDAVYLERVDEMYLGLRLRNGGHLFNDFYDDEQWMGIALLRAHTLTGNERYLQAAVNLWNDIRHGWNDTYGGGISWRKSQRDYKNAPANGPAAILAARLYHVTGDETYLEWAQRLFAWLKDHLLDPQTSLVWDGINRTGDGQIDKGWLFTYNQGTFVGAAVELWRATGDEGYLADARATAHAALARLTDPSGVFLEDGQGDGGLFKGILVRYLVELYRVERDPAILAGLRANADSLWRARMPENTFGPRWRLPRHYGRVDLSTQLSAVKLFNLVALAERIAADEGVTDPAK